jgi:hypothetical protein
MKRRTLSWAACVAAFAFASLALAADDREMAAEMQHLIQTYHKGHVKPGLRPVRVIYLVPSDSDPLKDYRERVERMILDVRDFYREGMERNGFGPTTFDVEKDKDGKLLIRVVKGKERGDYYHYRHGADRPWRAAADALKREGIDLEKETIVLITANTIERGTVIQFNAPYCGGGGPDRGTGWVSDSTWLDTRNLTNTEIMIEHGRPERWDLGRLNSAMIGGIAHELGHGFGLPHACERDSEKPVLGTALMGSGNYTYRRELRGKELGSFLTFASAVRLASHPCFIHSERGVRDRANVHFDSISMDLDGKEIVVSGKLTAQPAPYAVIIFNDPPVHADYDAVTWVAPVKPDGTFTVRVGEVKPGPSELRMEVLCVSGWGVARSFDFTADENGVADLTAPRRCARFLDAFEALAHRDFDAVRKEAAAIREDLADDPEALVWCRQLERLAQKRSYVSPAKVPDDVKTAWLAELAWKSAETGWLPPARDYLPYEEPGPIPFFIVEGQFFETGLYGHAPSRYVFDLGGKWKKLASKFGFAPGNGSCIFVVKGDGKELFRTDLIEDRKLHELEVDVTGVKTLELIIDDAVGNYYDLAHWLAPELSR